MNSFFKNKIKSKSPQLNRGMTYVELIVVLSIFSIVYAVVIFNYQKFQAKVDIQNLSNDIALRLVEAQKSALAGALPPLSLQGSISANWKPTYGLYFDMNNKVDTPDIGRRIFYYFVDLDLGGVSAKDFDHGTYSCPNNECLEKIIITKGNYISSIQAIDEFGGAVELISGISITFTRPNAGASFVYNGSPITAAYIDIIVVAQEDEINSTIRIYPSGRIELI